MPFMEDINKTIKQTRRDHKATTQSAESNFNAPERYVCHLTEAARRGELDPVIGRDGNIRRTIQTLRPRQMSKSVPLGEPEVDKIAVAEGFAQRIISGEVLSSICSRRLIGLDMEALVAGCEITW